tara:strand:- start:1121 stop:1957 length:837 start_codon:yes stop_codon:yes gene_type:complete
MSAVMKIEEINEENLAKIAAMIGQTDTSRPAAAGLPRLAIEQQNETSEGDVLPKGSFRLRMGDQSIYAKELEVRLFVRYYSYDLWNNENPELSIRTVLAPSLSDDFPDTSGGNKCGKLSKDEVANLSSNSIEHARQKSIKCTQVVYGVVTSADGSKTIDGEDVDVKGTPFVWSARGSAFMPVANHIREVPSNKIMFGQKAKVTTKRNVNGSVIYYTPVFDKPKPVKVVEKDIELLNTFMEDIEKWNSKAIKEYNERKETVLARDDLDVANSLEAADSI